MAELTAANVRLHDMFRQEEQTATQNAVPVPDAGKDEALEEAFNSRKCGTRSAMSLRFKLFLDGCDQETKRAN